MKGKSNFLSKLSIVLVVLLAAMVVTACKSKEEKVISQMESICETVESEDFNSSDLEKVEQQYQEILEQAKDCDFTAEQSKQLGEIQGRITAAFAKQAAGKVGDMLEDGVKAAEGFVEGFGKSLEGEKSE